MKTLILQLPVPSPARVLSLKFQQAGKQMVYLRYNLADGQSHTINIRLVAYLPASRFQSDLAWVEHDLSDTGPVSHLITTFW